MGSVHLCEFSLTSSFMFLHHYFHHIKIGIRNKIRILIPIGLKPLLELFKRKLIKLNEKENSPTPLDETGEA